MKQTAINPHTWSGGLGFDQAQLVGGHHSGQDAVAADGNAPGHGAALKAQPCDPSWPRGGGTSSSRFGISDAAWQRDPERMSAPTQTVEAYRQKR
jgi:hypothetical protein